VPYLQSWIPIIQQAKKKQAIVLQVKGVSPNKAHVSKGKGTQEAQNPKNLGIHISPLSSAAIVHPARNNNPAGIPKAITASRPLPFHQSERK
jgi:hypothetical protein